MASAFLVSNPQAMLGAGDHLKMFVKLNSRARSTNASCVIAASLRSPNSAASVSTVTTTEKKSSLIIKESQDLLERTAKLVVEEEEEQVGTLEEVAVKTLPLQQTKKRHKSELSRRWREIQGANNWEGLLDQPMDICLRSEIIRYGEFAQSCYDAFDMNTHSKYCGLCKYSKKELFDRVGLPGRGYKVTKYLYATADPEIPLFFRKSEAKDAWSRDSNWIGYVAVATDEEEVERLGRRDIVVAWRGTVTSLEWLENLKDMLTPAALDQRHRSNRSANKSRSLLDLLEDVKVERGFLHLYTSKKKMRQSAREQLLWEIHRLVGKYKDEQLSITITGHSLGGALALLSAYDIAESGMDEPLTSVVSENYIQEGSQAGSMDPIFESLPRPHNEDDDPTNNIPITVFSFAAPRVGNDAFRDRCNSLGIKVLRVVNEKDLVPKMPGIVFNENCFPFLRKWIDDLPWTYSHVGRSLQLSSDESPLLQPTMNMVWHHNLEAYLHLVDGHQGPGKPFSPVINRDPALVNKGADFLKPELGVPPCWWQEMHKGLVQDASGRWVQPERQDDEEADEDL